MKSADPPPTPRQGRWPDLPDVEARPASSARGRLPSPAVYDSADTGPQENDPTHTFLHQLSQTLTVLRGTLELALLVDCDAQDYRKAIQQSLVQAEGLVQLFKSYRSLAQGKNGWPGESK